MAGKNDIHKALPAVILGTFVLVFGLFESQSSFAGGCGRYCNARQVRAFCHGAVTTKGVQGEKRDLEFSKCKTDPMTQKRIEELADDSGDSLK